MLLLFKVLATTACDTDMDSNHIPRTNVLFLPRNHKIPYLFSSGKLCSVDWYLVTEILDQAVPTAWPLKMGALGFLETSVTKYNLWRSHLHYGGSLKSHKIPTQMGQHSWFQKLWFISSRCKRFFTFQKHPNWYWVPPSLLVNKYWGFFPWE